MAGKKVLPPPLPSDVLARVLRLARTDGRMLLVVAGAFALISAVSQQGLGAAAGCLAAGCGALELHGATLLRQGELRGLAWLVRSQLALMLVVIAYAVARVLTFDAALIESLITPEMREQFALAGVGKEEIVPMMRLVYEFMYTLVGMITVAYQGGMAWYYRRKAPFVAAALEDAGER